MDLKCKKTNCKHNNCYACMCKDVKISPSCECATFEKTDNLTDKQKELSNRTMFETAPEMHPYRHNRLKGIDCSANCLFNNEGQCKANGICVCEDNSKATCSTFIEK